MQRAAPSIGSNVGATFLLLPPEDYCRVWWGTAGSVNLGRWKT